jgi:hypothetical protein
VRSGGERILDRAFDPLELRRFAERPPVRVLAQEIVDRPAGPRGVDARIDDVGAGEMDH